MESVPEYASDYVTVKSCEKPLYCATSCNDGYVLNGCVCSPNSCPSAFKKLSELGNLPLDDLKYFNYDTCKSGDDTLYYIKSCASGFLNKNTQSCSGFWGDGAAANGFNCKECNLCKGDEMLNAKGDGCCLKSQNVCASDTYLTGTCPTGSEETQNGYTNDCGYACHACKCDYTCGTGYAYDGMCPAGTKQDTVSGYGVCGKPCYKCISCDYQYDIAHYSNVKSGSKSCVRDGVTYYEEVCSGQQAPRSPCNGDNDKYWSHVCYSYNGMPYPYGTCNVKPTVKLRVTKQNSGYMYYTDYYVDVSAKVDGKTATAILHHHDSAKEVEITKVMPNDYPVAVPNLYVSAYGAAGGHISCIISRFSVGNSSTCYSNQDRNCSQLNSGTVATLEVGAGMGTVYVNVTVTCESR